MLTAAMKEIATEPDVALVAITASLMSFVFISSKRVNAPDATHHLEDTAFNGGGELGG